MASRTGMSRSEAFRRRRDVLTVLGLAAALTFALAVASSNGSVWIFHLGVDALVLGYLALLMQRQQRLVEARAKVRYLPAHGRHAQHAPQPALLRRQAN